MTSTEGLVERLESENAASMIVWCNHCGRMSIMRYRGPSEILNEGNNRTCRGTMLVGSPSEALTHLKARQMMEE